jgi:hypothetical protein
MEFTEKQISDFKKQYGKVFLFTCSNDNTKSCILRTVGRNEESLANISAVSRNDDGKANFDPNKYNEAILLSCWVAGDEEIKTNDALFLGIADKLHIITQKAAFDVKEL